MLGEGTGVISFYFNYRLYTAQILLLLTYSWCNLCQFTSRTALLPALPMSQPYKKAARVKSNIPVYVWVHLPTIYYYSFPLPLLLSWELRKQNVGIFSTGPILYPLISVLAWRLHIPSCTRWVFDVLLYLVMLSEITPNAHMLSSQRRSR